MSKEFPMVPLGEVLSLYQEYVDELEQKVYPKLSVKLYGKGVALDTPVDSSSLKMKRHQIAKSGQVILSEIWGKKGAIGLVPLEGEDALCTSHFFLFNVCHNKIDSQYLQAIFTANYLQNQLDNEAKGTTGYAAVRPRHLLSSTIPLPSLNEQQRIVARIEELATKTEEARVLRKETMEEAKGLVFKATSLVFEKLEMQYASKRPLSKSATITGGGTPSKADYALWQGTIPWVSPKDMKVNTIYDTEDHISKLALETGVSTLIPENSVLIVVRSGILRRTLPVSINKVQVTINQDMKALTPFADLSCDFLAWWFKYKEPAFLENVKGGTTVQSLVWDKVKNFEVPIPPLSEQQNVVSYLDEVQAKVDTMKRIQAETSVELDALLPSILDKAFKGEL